jgi:heparosan-N-sulfate-glucuronate 5-epimerase
VHAIFSIVDKTARHVPPVKRLRYYQRIFRAYLLPGKSHLTFWHETPRANARASFDRVGEYYMDFSAKANYAGYYDASGIPMLDYHGQIGLQYNPIAIAQYGLGNYNFFMQEKSEDRRTRFLAAADWLVGNLEQNGHGILVWNHHFDWEYRDTLKAPWYSGLAQGQGISLLVRAHGATQDSKYHAAARQAFESLLRPMDQGGVLFTDDRGDVWIEEYLVNPPTHILNGMIWALWGVHDYALATGEEAARQLFDGVVLTLSKNLAHYDAGFWSLYEQSGTRLKMVASPFYHRLHIVQLGIMHRLTGQHIFQEYAERWESYERSLAKRAAALCYKSAFKLCYY